MSEVWRQVDEYITASLIDPDPGAPAREVAEAAGLPDIAVTPRPG